MNSSSCSAFFMRRFLLERLELLSVNFFQYLTPYLGAMILRLIHYILVSSASAILLTTHYLPLVKYHLIQVLP